MCRKILLTLRCGKDLVQFCPSLSSLQQQNTGFFLLIIVNADFIVLRDSLWEMKQRTLLRQTDLVL